MKRSKLLAAVLCGALMIGGTSLPVMADATKVVTLGADLTEAQKQTMMNYFKANPSEVQILTITNQDERNHLGAYIPLAQIGTRTLSCAYVKPTQSGGIRVRTANLNYVTGNMIASTLSTSGVTNCEVIAACPFEVSGTGALTGIQMAYETATGTQLDPVKKDLAAQEIVVTGNVANQVGNNEATRLVNDAKIEVLQNDIHNETEIYNIVNNICYENNIVVNETAVNEVVNLMVNISEQNYNYEDMSVTLENVNNNVTQVTEINNGETAADPEQVQEITETEETAEAEEEYDPDSILNDIDETDLGENIPTSSTEDPALEVSTYDPAIEMGESGDVPSTGDVSEEVTETDEFGIPLGEETVINPEGGEESTEEQFEESEGTVITPETEGTEETSGTEENAEGQEAEFTPETGETEEYTQETEAADAAESTDAQPADDSSSDARAEMIALLSEQAKSQYDAVLKFCRGEFEDDKQALSEAMGPDFTPSYTFTDKETAKKLSELIGDKYLEAITAPYTPDGTEKYFSDELNAMVKSLKAIFGIEGTATDTKAAELLKDITTEDKALIYNDCLTYFEKFYGEAPIPAEESTEEPAEEQPEEQPEEQYEEPQYEESYDDYSYTEDAYTDDSYTDDSYAYTEDYSIPEGTDEYY